MPLRIHYNITALESNSVKITVTLLLYITALRSGITRLLPEMKLLKKKKDNIVQELSILIQSIIGT
jgi:hypothetical protein